MGKKSSSFVKRKPLFFTSLAVSLALHAGGLYFLLKHPFSFFQSAPKEEKEQTLVHQLETDLEVELALSETLSRLIMKNEEPESPSFDRPHLEVADQTLTFITNYSYTPKIHPALSTHAQFSIRTPDLMIEKNEASRALKPPFGPKKWINFSQELEALAQTNKMVEEEVEFNTQPHLESEEAEKISTALCLPPPKEPQISPPEISLAEKDIQLQPSHEHLGKAFLDRESLYFFYNETLKETPPFPFKMELLYPGNLVAENFALPKSSLKSKTVLAGSFFASIAPLDLSPFVDESDVFSFDPQTEEVHELHISPAKVKGQFSSVELARTSHPFSPTEVTITPPLLAFQVVTPSIALKQTFGQTFPSYLPNLPEETQSPSKQRSLHCPHKENVKKELQDPSLTLAFDNVQEEKYHFQTIDAPEQLALSPSRKVFPRQKLSKASSCLSIKSTLPQETSPAFFTPLEKDHTPEKEALELAFDTQVPSGLSRLVIPRYHYKRSSSQEVPFSLENSSMPLSTSSLVSPDLATLPHEKSHLDFSSATPRLAKRKTAPQTDTLPFRGRAYPFTQHLLSLSPAPSLAQVSDPFSLQKHPLTCEVSLSTSSLAFDLLKDQPLFITPSFKPCKKELQTSRPALDLSSVTPRLAEKRATPQTDAFPFRGRSYPFTHQLLSQTPAPSPAQMSDSFAAQKNFLAFEMSPPASSLSFDLNKESTPVMACALKPDKMKLQTIEKISAPNLPPITQKKPNDKVGFQPKKMLEEIPNSAQLAALASRKKHVSNMKELISKQQSPFDEAQQEIPLPEITYLEPNLSTPKPSKGPLLDLEDNRIALQQHELDYAKNSLEIPEPLASPALPMLKQKKMAGRELLSPPQKALELSEIDDYLALVPREASFPFTKSLLSQIPVPLREVQSDLASFIHEVKDVETDDIQSESTQLIEKLHSETVAQNSPVNMSTPDIEKVLSEKDFHTTNETHRTTQQYLSEIPAPSNLKTLSFNSEFETEVTYVKKPDGTGYHFALKIKPNERLYFSSPEQNIIFVVDGSSSIKKHRYNTFKDAVVKALGYMHEGDTFNILVADSEIAAMSQEPLFWNKNAIKKARNYLHSRTYRGFFSNYDAFYLIAKATQYFDPDKENVIVFISDGHSLDTIKKHKEEFKELTEASKGRFSIFAACASHNNNLTMLDLLSTFNQGEFMYSPTNAAFPRKLAVLVKHIESCVAKDIRLHVTSSSDRADIQFYPSQDTYPSLYADRAYTLYGSTDTLEDFDLILQGRSGEHWVNIKQHITFRYAEVAGYKLKRNFALQQAYVCYDYYLKQNDPFFLAEAERILMPHSIIPATR